MHEHLVGQGQVDFQHVQTDELWIRIGSRHVTDDETWVRDQHVQTKIAGLSVGRIA